MREAKPLYRHVDVALLRAAAAALTDAPERWPDPGDIAGCRTWLDKVWSNTDFAEAITMASRSLADRVMAIRTGRAVDDKQVRRATLATARYLLRSIGRPTPFGLFAGVTGVTLGRSTDVRWGSAHRCLARVNTVWLADVIDRLESCPELLDRLNVQVNDLAVRRGGRLEVPHGPNRVSIRNTHAVDAVRDAAAIPIRFGTLAAHLATAFPAADPATVRAMLTDLVGQDYLITNLRAPFTMTDPLAHLLDQLHTAGADTLADAAPDTAALVRDLDDIHAELARHNDADPAEQPAIRETITSRMAEVSGQGRTLLTGDLVLDCAVWLPQQVAREMEQAASALLRLTRHPAGEPTWRAYHAAFVDRYGTSTLVPLVDVLDPDTGLGYPAGYPGSVLPTPSSGTAERDQRLLALAWEAISTGTGEITLTDEMIAALTGEGFAEPSIPPHVELAARVHAPSIEALDRGEFTLSVAPARAAGTLTSRFTPLATGTGLAEAYRGLPAATENALRVQLSFGPLYPNAENVCRVPAYLDHLLPLGEHRHLDDTGGARLLTVNDLGVTATRDRLHLVSLSRRRVVEPQVFHALDLRKQPPAVVRFLAHLPRAFSAGWYQFDWGPHVNLPRLPRVRYRRTVLFPAQWRLTPDDLADPHGGREWRQALDRWRARWDCPAVVELRDADRTLRLTLDEPIHLELLRAHLARHGQAILIEAAPPSAFGWLGGHVHEIAVPLVTTGKPAPNPLREHLPVVTNSHGQVPGAPATRWLSAKLFTHPERMNEIIAEHLPTLLATLDAHGFEAACWWLRYRGPHETDHLRLRLRTATDRYGTCTNIVGEWSQRMRDAGLVGRLVLDTYLPEVGRYGQGPALEAAENVFVADSAAVAALLRHQPTTDTDLALVVANMVGIVTGFFGDPAEAMTWLAARPVAATPAVNRAVTDRAILLATEPAALAQIPGWAAEIGPAWARRAYALRHYRKALPAQASVDVVLESVLHMLHNRLVGIDPDSERTCRRLARQAALAWRARHHDGGTAR
ncbi:lantibiotic dehydratase [Gandjariella thermophila]|nr:lantibiotic dehydratase [Gandjariella thermophila]